MNSYDQQVFAMLLNGEVLNRTHDSEAASATAAAASIAVDREVEGISEVLK